MVGSSIWIWRRTYLYITLKLDTDEIGKNLSVLIHFIWTHISEDS